MRYTLILFSMATNNKSSSNWNKLSRAWINDFTTSPANNNNSTSIIQNAIQRTLPLLFDDPTSVPFICRYRSDVISPLTTKQVHQLSDTIQRYESLSSLRGKILDKLSQSTGDYISTIHRVETSHSKTELEDIYLPFKPASKGSLEDRINEEYPKLVGNVDTLWNTKAFKDISKLKPMDKAVTLLANRIANDVEVVDALMDYSKRQCRVEVKEFKQDIKKKKTSGSARSSSSSTTYETYHNYNNKVYSLRNHQVLAIRRGVAQKQLKISFDIDEGRVDRIIEQTAFKSSKQSHQLYIDARRDAWTRLLKKRITNRLWKDVSSRAEEQSIHVFCDNLSKALLSPPPISIIKNHKALVALDPGFQAGIKCAILSNEGKVVSLDTVKFLGSAKESGKAKITSLLKNVQKISNSKVLVVLGNGHGTREARSLLVEAAQDGDIETEVQLVTEAGASVWSVTEQASAEFPNEPPAAIAAVSIGRRYLNPLNELVKIPPRSLGLGMYQHDLSEKILDEKLSLTSIDAVAEVGVDINSCSLAILSKVPSLTPKLCEKIMKARPLKSRSDLLKISGLGQKTFRNSAAFVRVSSGGSEALDATLVHPESYDLARWLLKELQWKLSTPSSVKVGLSEVQQKEEWEVAAQKASSRFDDVTSDRCMTVIEHLYFSITSPDPRLRKKASEQKTSSVGSSSGCSSLPAHASTIDKLRDSQLPIRNIIATVRNVVDFGAFVDLGLECDGLIHRSKMGNVPLNSLLVGEEVGVDILGISNNNKISVGLCGLELPAESRGDNKRQYTGDRKPAAKKQRKGK